MASTLCEETLNLAMNRLADAERQFMAARFLAPVARKGGVGVRIASVRCLLSVRPEEFSGWGVFAPESLSAAALVRPATQKEREEYLSLFPAVRLIVVARSTERPLAMRADLSDMGVVVQGQAPVELAPDIGQFESIIARYEGQRLWFDRVDPRGNAATAAYLRAALERLDEPSTLVRRGLTAAERLAYTWAYQQQATALTREAHASSELRRRGARAHSEALLTEFVETNDAFRVTFNFEGGGHTAPVDRDDLMVRSAGICLSGQDQKFDLGSLVGVLREGNQHWGRPEIDLA